MNFLRQSTAVDVGIGPFIDDDGITPATGLSITQAEVRLKKNNGAWGQCNDNTTATHEEEGWYEKELDTTDTGTVGILILAVYISGNLAYWTTFQVVEEAVYDALYAASATGNTAAVVSILSDTTHIHSDTTAIHTQTTTIASDVLSQFAIIEPYVSDIYSDTTAIHTQTTAIVSDTTAIHSDTTVIDTETSSILSDLLIMSGVLSDVYSDTVLLTAAGDGTVGAYPELGIIDQGTAQSASSTTLVLRAATPFGSDDACNGAALLAFGSDQGYWQARTINDYTTADDTATVDAWDVTPSGTITYKVFGTPPGGAGSLTATQASQLTRIQSDVISQFAVVEPYVSDIYSDSTAIHSQTTKVLSDTTAIHSDTTAVHSDTTAIHSDTTAMHLQTTTIASDLLVLSNEISDIYSDTTLLVTNVAAVDSQVTATDSQLTVTDAVADTIASDLLIVSGVLSDVYSDTTALTAGVNITHVIGNPVQENGATDTNWGGTP